MYGFEWGAERGDLIDCGYMIYGAATKSNLEKLDQMQHRVLVEAMQTTAINALLIERNEIPLDVLELNQHLCIGYDCKVRRDMLL